MNIEQYKEKIKNLKPLEQAESYSSTQWKALNDDLKKSVEDFIDKDISRGDIIEAFRAFYTGQVSVERPFTLTMLWGFATIGYGVYRTNLYYNEKTKIEEALAFIKDNEFEKAYKKFDGIKGLSISYISKLLYFATRALNNEKYCLIFDIRVAKSLVKIHCPDICGFLEIYPSPKYKSYKQYNELMHREANKYGLEADALELFLFDQKF